MDDQNKELLERVRKAKALLEKIKKIKANKQKSKPKTIVKNSKGVKKVDLLQPK